MQNNLVPKTILRHERRKTVLEQMPYSLWRYNFFGSLFFFCLLCCESATQNGMSQHSTYATLALLLLPLMIKSPRHCSYAPPVVLQPCPASHAFSSSRGEARKKDRRCQNKQVVVMCVLEKHHQRILFLFRVFKVYQKSNNVKFYQTLRKNWEPLQRRTNFI
jgi:hypothetical protein